MEWQDYMDSNPQTSQVSGGDDRPSLDRRHAHPPRYAERAPRVAAAAHGVADRGRGRGPPTSSSAISTSAVTCRPRLARIARQSGVNVEATVEAHWLGFSYWIPPVWPRETCRSVCSSRCAGIEDRRSPGAAHSRGVSRYADQAGLPGGGSGTRHLRRPRSSPPPTSSASSSRARAARLAATSRSTSFPISTSTKSTMTSTSS